MQNLIELYHGSPRKINILEPKLATGMGKDSNRQIGVYATDKKDRAIAMALIHLKGIKGGTRLNFPSGKVDGIVFNGWPTQKYFYLHILPSESFEKVDSWQYISKECVVPVRVERLKVSDYIHMLRKGTRQERANFDKAWREFENAKFN